MKIPFARFAAAIACALLVVQTPADARFLQVDPVGYKDQTNLYAYVRDDPVNRTDPSGMCEFYCTANYFNEDANRQTLQAEARISNEIGRSLYEGSGVGALVEAIRNPSPGNTIVAMVGVTPVGRIEAAFMRTASAAYRTAAMGGTHAGTLRSLFAMSDRQVGSSLRSYERTIAEHREKIAHPERYMVRESPNDPAAVARARHDWQNTIDRAAEQRDIARDELRRRGL